jgi:hypothetical protein
MPAFEALLVRMVARQFEALFLFVNIALFTIFAT